MTDVPVCKKVLTTSSVREYLSLFRTDPYNLDQSMRATSRSSSLIKQFLSLPTPRASNAAHCADLRKGEPARSRQWPAVTRSVVAIKRILISYFINSITPSRYGRYEEARVQRTGTLSGSSSVGQAKPKQIELSSAGGMTSSNCCEEETEGGEYSTGGKSLSLTRTLGREVMRV